MAADQIPLRVVLVVDECRPSLWRMARVLEVHGFHPTVATPPQSFRAAVTFLPDVAIVGPVVTDSIAATLVDEIRADTGLRYTPIIVLRGHQDDQRRDGFSDNHFTEVLADTEHFDDVVEAVRTRSRSSPGRQVLREMRRSLVG